jgi:hypothetical protein
MQTMTYEQAQTHLKTLSREFGVKPPELRLSPNTRGSYYHTPHWPSTLKKFSLAERNSYLRGVISVGLADPRWSLQNTLLHEFAHHLTCYLHGPMVNHQRPFCESLERVTRFFYGDTRLYPWKDEYVCVRNYAKRVGLCE